MYNYRVFAILLSLCLFQSGQVNSADDIPIADFEGENYGAWKVTGEAFGPGPARGTLPNQMNVSGYEGNGLVNSFYNGDKSTGTLTSPSFTIKRKYINFLIGGGMHPNETCINLSVDGQIVRTATGPNDKPGGSERLDWASWDVSELQGKNAVIEIVDTRTDGWGHINIDRIVQSDTKRQAEPAARTITIENNFLHFPVQNGASMRHVKLMDGETLVQEFDIELADNQTDLWALYDGRRLKGKTISIQVGLFPPNAIGLNAITQDDEVPKIENLYREKYRPQYHFSPRYGWTNDPNGLVYYKGKYHLFFQHNPFGIKWGNMTWGHATSPDLLHWEQHGNAIEPDRLGTIFSGSAAIDWNNTSGFQSGDEKPLVCFYTSAGAPFTQSLAYSTDGGVTFTKYAGNPILGNIHGANRDPKVFWHEPSRQWVMALYLDRPSEYTLYASSNLKEWKHLCDLKVEGSDECPDMFELVVDGDSKNTRWVYWGANGGYNIGTFDGTVFKTESGPFKSEYGKHFYAAQTWSDIPETDGRRLQIGWMNGGSYPGMPFNQQMSLPCVLTLRTGPQGVRLYREPVKELETLRTTHKQWKNEILKPASVLEPDLTGDLLEIETDIDVGTAKEIRLIVRGVEIIYSVPEKTLACLERTGPLVPQDGKIHLQIFLDRTSLEIFGNHGETVMSFCFIPPENDMNVRLAADGGEAVVNTLDLWKLKSVWP